MFMLRNRAPERFTGGRAKAMSAADKETLRKLKLEWRAEWERERAILANQQALAAGDTMVETVQAMHRDWFTSLSPQARAAYRAFRAIEDADDGSWLDGIGQDGDGDTAGDTSSDPGRDRVERALAQAEAEYEEWFGPAADRRPQVAKLVDMRAWQNDDDSEEDSAAAGENASDHGGASDERGEPGGDGPGRWVPGDDWGPTWADVGKSDPAKAEGGDADATEAGAFDEDWDR